MNFDDLKEHIEKYPCVFDHFDDGAWMVTNQFNFEECVIEEHADYSDVAISHYCNELKISIPLGLESANEKYLQMRSDSDKFLENAESLEGNNSSNKE